MNQRTSRRIAELIAVAAVLFCALSAVGLLQEQHLLLDTLDAGAIVAAEREREQEQSRSEKERARRFGAQLEDWRRTQLASVARIRETLAETRAFRHGVHHIALDAKGRILLGGAEESDLWLGVLRLGRDGSVDREFLAHVSRGFEDDTRVGNVQQVLPLPDGRILLVGYFGKPRTLGLRHDDPGAIPFLLLDARGRIDKGWLRELVSAWPKRTSARGPVFLGATGEVIFLGASAQFGDGELRTLTIANPPRLGAAVPLSHPIGICSVSDSELLILSRGPRLEVIRRDGSLVRDLTPGFYDETFALSKGTRRGGDPSWLFCDDGRRALSIRQSTTYSLDYDVVVPHTATRILVLEGGEIRSTIDLQRRLVPKVARFSERLQQWRVYGDPDGLFTIAPDPPSVVPEHPLSLMEVTSLLELRDGRLLLAVRSNAEGLLGESRPARLFQLAPAAGDPVPF